MQEINNFLQRFLCLVLSGYVRKLHAAVSLHIYLGIAFAKGHEVAAHAGLLHPAHQQRAQAPEQQQRQNQVYQQHRPNGGFLGTNLGEGRSRGIQPVHQFRVIHGDGVIIMLGTGSNEPLRPTGISGALRAAGVVDHVLLHLDLIHVLGIQVVQEGIVAHFRLLRLRAEQLAVYEAVENHHRNHGDDAADNDFLPFLIIHVYVHLLQW